MKVFLTFFFAALLLTIQIQPVLSKEASLPDRWEKIFSEGKRFENEKKSQEALAEYLKILKKYPDSVKTLERTVYIYMTSKQFDKALENARKAVSTGGKTPISHNILGMHFEQIGEPGKAEKYYLKSIESDSAYASPYNNLGNIYLKRGLSSKAREYYKKAIDYDASNPLFHNNLGLAMELSGNIEEALTEYRKALSLNKSYKTAADNLRRAESKINPPKITAEEKKLANSIVKINVEKGFVLVAAYKSQDGSKTAIYDYKKTFRLIARELPPKNNFNETIFAQMIFEHKPELATLLKNASEADKLRITGQGYIPALKRPIFYTNVEYEKNNIPFEGIFTIISKKQNNKHILISASAGKGYYKKAVPESFIKNAVKNL